MKENGKRNLSKNHGCNVQYIEHAVLNFVLYVCAYASEIPSNLMRDQLISMYTRVARHSWNTTFIGKNFKVVCLY